MNFSKSKYQKKILKIIKKIKLQPKYIDRYPHIFSGGQRQRIGIARALILNPEIIIYNKPVSALNISIQARVINLLINLQNQMNLTYIFISHDLDVVRHIADDVLVMYLSK